MFGALDTSASGMVAQRTRLDVIAANLANRNAIYDDQGNYAPYRRRIPIFATGDSETGRGDGVHVSKVLLDQSDLRQVYEPGHPEADANGYVGYPNIDPTTELINAMEASRAYEANITAAEATKTMMQSSLRLLA